MSKFTPKGLEAATNLFKTSLEENQDAELYFDFATFLKENQVEIDLLKPTLIRFAQKIFMKTFVFPLFQPNELAQISIHPENNAFWKFSRFTVRS